MTDGEKKLLGHHTERERRCIERWNQRVIPNNIPGVITLSDEEFDAITRQPVETSPPLAPKFDVGQRVRFIDPAKDHAEWVVTRESGGFVYLYLSNDRTYTHFAKQEELAAVNGTGCP